MLDPKPRQHFKSVLDLYPDDIKIRFINLKARYLSIGSVMSDRGEKFVEKIFQNTEIFNFSENDLRPLTRSDERFDCFIIGGKDAARICRFMHSNADALQSSAKICLTVSSSPQRRALLLMAGFDDVFDIEKIELAEAVARILSIERRYLFAERIKQQNSRLSDKIDAVSNEIKLTSRERHIIELFISSSNNELSIAKLKIAISEYSEYISNGNIKVIISNLRKKLSKDYTINFIEPSSYKLEKILF